jgi:glutamate transport system permease protein
VTSVLYDAPGPRTRRRTRIATAVALAVVVGLGVLAARRLAANDQFDPEKWGPLFNPANRFFVATWSALGAGLANTVVAAALTVVFALVIGTVLTVLRITSGRSWRWLVVGVVELLRGLPVVITIYFASRVLPELGITLAPLWYLVVGLTAYNCVIIAEIIRSGVAALPRGQNEAASALGFSRGQALRLILLPQAFRVMLPALISQLVVIVKDTSLGFVVFGFAEFVRAANNVIQFFGGAEGVNLPLQMYVAVALVFIAINYSLGKLAEYVDRRGSRVRAPGAAAVPLDPALVEAGAGRVD